MDQIWQDIGYAVRTLIRKPAFAAAAVLTLALGIGANTAIFSVVDASMLRPLPFQEPGRLAGLWWHSTQAGYSTPVQSAGAWMEWRQQTDLFQQVEAYETSGVILRGQGRPETIPSAAASAGLFDVLGVPALIGRTHESGEEGVVVLAYELWQTRFGGDQAVLGQTLTLDDQPYTVIGVMPSYFRFPYPHTRLWHPYRLSGTPEERLRQRASLLVRMHEGDAVENLQERVDAVSAVLDEEKPVRRSWSSRLYPLQRGPSPKTRTALMVLLAAVGMVLLIACANAANLMLSQSGKRSRAIAVRAALGAGRMRLLRLMLAESLILAFAGAALGSIIALWTVDLIMGMAPDDLSIFQLNSVRVDQRVLLFSAALATLTGILFGLLPALKISKPDLLETLKHGSRSCPVQSSRWVRNGLVTAEVALSLVLLVGAGLLISSFLRLVNVGTGLGTERVLAVSLTLDSNRYPDPAQQDAFFDRLLEGAAALPEVEAASLGSGVPPEGGGFSFGFGNIEVEGQEAGEPDYNQMLPFYSVGPDYFQVLGIPVLQGRSFGSQDSPESPPAVIINQALARRYWGQGSPLGSRMRVGSSGKWRTVVGVARDVRSIGLDNPFGDLAVYYPYSQQPNRHRNLIVRTAGPPENVIDSLRQLIWTIDDGQPIEAFQTLDDLVADTLTSQRFYLTLFMVFAGLALFLAAFGIYGVVSYSVTERTHEIGVRMAVGAGRRQILRLIVRQGMLPVALGVVIGLVSALGLARYIESWLYEIQPTDPGALVSVALALLLVALAACLFPARRATKVDPIIALRTE